MKIYTVISVRALETKLDWIYVPVIFMCQETIQLLAT